MFFFSFFLKFAKAANESKPGWKKTDPDTKSLAATGGGLKWSVAAALQSPRLNATLTPQVRTSAFRVSSVIYIFIECSQLKWTSWLQE